MCNQAHIARSQSACVDGQGLVTNMRTARGASSTCWRNQYEEMSETFSADSYVCRTFLQSGVATWSFNSTVEIQNCCNSAVIDGLCCWFEVESRNAITTVLEQGEVWTPLGLHLPNIDEEGTIVASFLPSSSPGNGQEVTPLHG